MNKRDYYEVLGVSKKASEQEIKTAYRKLAIKYHPDKQSGKSESEKKDAENKFKECTEAYEVLSNNEKREQYDRFGFDGPQLNGGFGAGGMDPREFFRQHMHNFGGFNPFGGGFGFGDDDFESNSVPDPNSPKDGRDIRINATFAFEDLIYGNKREFSINVEDPCEHCHGTGAENGELVKCEHCHGTGVIQQRVQNGFMISISTTPCNHCHGSGYIAKKKCKHCNDGRVKNTRHLNINIPKGIEPGRRLRVNGEGERGVNGGKNGDLYIVVNSSESDIFVRNGMNLASHVCISPITASIGGKIDIQTPWGVSSISIPPGTTNGRRFKLSGMGVEFNGLKGDLLVEVEIEPFVNLSKEQMELVEKLNKSITDENLKNSHDYSERCKKFESENKAKREKV